jgi:hypothetical protein
MQKDSPDNVGQSWRLVKIRLLQNDVPGALEKAGTMAPNSRQAAMIKAVLLQVSGQADAALTIMDDMVAGEVTGEGHYYLSLVHAWTGNREAAFEHLTKAVDARYRVLSYVLNEPFLFPIHDDPRWREQIDRVGLLDYWLSVPADYGGPAR